MPKYYIIIKSSNITSCYIKSEISGFHIKPQNKIKYDGIKVSKLTLIDSELIENVLRKKITKKLDAYLKYLINVLNTDDDDTDPDDLVLIINDLMRYKQIIINRYSKYLDSNYIRILLSKVKLVEDELKRKIKLCGRLQNSYGFRR